LKNLLRVFLKDKLNKLLILLLGIWLLLLFFDELNCKENDIYIYQNNKVLGYFTPEEFKNLVNNADKQVEQIDAEKENRVEIKVLDNPYKVEKENTYKARFRIIWYNEKKEIIKSIDMESTIIINEDSSNPYPAWRVTYRNISEYSLPVLIVLCVILGVL